MNETLSADLQLRSELAQVRFDYLSARMHKRIKAENEIHRRVGNHGQGAAVVHVAADIRNTRKTLLARFDTFTRLINGPELVAVVLQVMRPPPESRRDFQDRAGWQALTNTRKDCARPLRSGTAPWRRPFLARLFPIVLHGIVGTINRPINQEMAGAGIEPGTRGSLVHVSRDGKLFAWAAAINLVRLLWRQG